MAKTKWKFSFTDSSEPEDHDWIFAFFPSLNIGSYDGMLWIEFFWLTFHVELAQESLNKNDY